MIGLFDRDVFLKLGCLGLWVEAVDALGITHPYRLESTTSIASNRRILRRRFGADEAVIDACLSRIAQMVQSVPVVPAELLDAIEATETFQQLSGIEGIDGGEQALAAVLVRGIHERILITGDKRFVQALRGKLPELWSAVSGSVISFEACLKAIGAKHGLAMVIANAQPVCACDGTLRLALGGTPSESAFLEALVSFDPCDPR